MISDEDFLAQMQAAIRENRLTLPTLPEVALRVRDAVEKENSTAHEIAEMVATDAALSARLLQVANSPLYRRRTPVENIQTAITLMGNRLVRSLVINLVMKQIFQPTSDALDKRLREIWENSVQVAAISRVLAQSLPHLDNEQAMLGGLIHNIGALPILVFAEENDTLIEDEQHLDRVLAKLGPVLGQQILKSWDFPAGLCAVPGHCQELGYNGGPQADYVDVVLVARLQTLSGTDHPDAQADWSKVPSFAKVGLEPEINIIEIEGVADQVAAAEQSLLV